jgi:nitrate reductase NapE component
MLDVRRSAAQGEPMNSRRSVPLVVVVWLIVGAIVAGGHHYFDTLNSIGAILTAVLAVVLWPLILLGVKINIAT